MDEQINSNNESQKIAPPPVRPVSDVTPPGNLPFVEESAPRSASQPPINPVSKPEVSIRTMEADLKSLKLGAAPKAESVLPSAMKDIKEVPETVSQLGQVVSEQPRRSWIKTVIMILAVLVVGGGVGFIAYYYVYPLFIGTEEPISETPSDMMPPSALPVRLNHVSYFQANIPKTRVEFRALTAVTIAEALNKIEPAADGSLKEVPILDIGGGQIYFADFLGTLLPLTDADKNIISESLAQDFTAFLYYDANGVWPGYVAKLKSPAGADKLKFEFLPVMELFDLGSLYLAPVSLQPFKDGKYNSLETRYAVGSAPGASFNYAFAGDYLVLSTSFNGFKAAVMALGL